MELFLRDKDPVSVQCLACGGAELIESIATHQDLRPFSTHMLENNPGLDIKELRTLQRRFWNAFKHMSDRGGELRDDDAILATFDDTMNDGALFVAWWDYQSVTQKLPLAVQVFQVWFYALNEEKLAPGTSTDDIRRTFPHIRSAPREEQKRRLRRVIERYRSDKEILADSRTENLQLCFSLSRSH
ncbi:hypothetical protein [Bradyrhizobium sp. YR681]|uniref:hypothetical protein n=1 Tax=Bradyrhizobium sp. YR681 TaxID=1144344 RepID=UPI0012F69972|nr:hypothetical protein [Bradyrhizobium sp. YR681]